MTFFEIALIAFALSMDAFAISVCKGISLKKFNAKQGIVAGLYFGIFQMLMPFAGFLLSKRFESYIDQYAHWVSFGLLAFIGIKMIKDSFSADCEGIGESLAFKAMLLLAVATSIDALAVGVTFAYADINIFAAVLTIGLITFIMSNIGVLIGSNFSGKLKIRPELVGGLILIGIGLKVLIEHYWF